MKKRYFLPILFIGVTGWKNITFTNFEKVVENYSAVPIFITLLRPSEGFFSTDTLVVPPGHTASIYFRSEMEIETQPECIRDIDILKISSMSGKIILKDINDPENWTSTSTEEKSTIEHTCFFSILPSDIQ